MSRKGTFDSNRLIMVLKRRNNKNQTTNWTKDPARDPLRQRKRLDSASVQLNQSVFISYGPSPMDLLINYLQRPVGEIRIQDTRDDRSSLFSHHLHHRHQDSLIYQDWHSPPVILKNH